MTDLGLRGPPSFTPQERGALDNLEVVRAVEILYALDERDLLASIIAELGESGTDIAGIAALGEIAGKHDDGRAMLLLGKGALRRAACRSTTTPFRPSACPTTSRSRPPIEPAVVYSIARQESEFNQKVVSTANAMGLMQVTPAAGA